MDYIVIGGGLSGLSAAHTIIQKGGSVVLLERNMFMGGNSTKATSGMNGGGTRTQKALGVPDTKEIFEEDMIRGATGVYDRSKPCPEGFDLATVVAHTSADCIHWIQDNFGLALDAVSRLGGHSQPRTHRSKNGTTFPGMEITYALMKEYEALTKSKPDQVKLITKARVTKLLTDTNGRISGCDYEDKAGKVNTLSGKAVIVATGGYGAGGLFKDSLLYDIRPELCHLPTTNGEHCVGDGIKFSQAIGAAAVDLEHVQVHPTGLVHLDDPDNRVKFLAAEALRGEGGILIDKDGKRFCNDLGTRDYVTTQMWKHNNGPYRLILTEKSYKNIEWHCKHYCGRRVMKHYNSGVEIAKDMGIPPEQLQAEFDRYNGFGANDNDPWGKKYFNGLPLNVNQKYMCAVVTPVVHYTMGGLKINGDAEVMHQNGTPLLGLYAAGEATGGVHGRNRLGGSALLECVAIGRVAGKKALEYVSKPATSVSAAPLITISIPQSNGAAPITLNVNGGGIVSASEVAAPKKDYKFCGSFEISTIPVGGGICPKDWKGPNSEGAVAEEAAPAAAEVAKGGTYSVEEVAKHNKESDVWVIVGDDVLDVTKFLPDHPGGKMALMAFAGRDATTEFEMVHEEGVIEKYAPETVIGKLKPSSKL